MGKLEIMFRYIPRDGNPFTLLQTISMEAYHSSNSDILEHAARLGAREFSEDLDIELETEKYNPKRHTATFPFKPPASGIL